MIPAATPLIQEDDYGTPAPTASLCDHVPDVNIALPSATDPILISEVPDINIPIPGASDPAPTPAPVFPDVNIPQPGADEPIVGVHTSLPAVDVAAAHDAPSPTAGHAL